MKETENKEDSVEDEEIELIAICRGCGFSAHPDKFDISISLYHDLRCPKCKTTDIDWTYGSYKDNTLVTDPIKDK